VGEKYLMSRTTLCVVTAAGLAAAAVGLMIGRCRVLGDEVRAPSGPGAWKVALVVRGASTAADARLTTAIPLDFGRQHTLNEDCRSAELLPKPPDAKHPERHQVLWSLRGGTKPGPFRAVYDFQCTVNTGSPTTSMSQLARRLYAPPQDETAVVRPAAGDNATIEIDALARRLTTGVEEGSDQFAALFHYVDQQIANEPNVEGSNPTALECLRTGAGDSAAKSKLLGALCQSCGIAARLVSGLALKTGHEQKAHVWVEAWVNGHWLSACPYYHHLGRVPASYLIFHFGDAPLVRGRAIRDLHFTFMVERGGIGEEGAVGVGSPLHRLLTRLSLYALPPTEQRLVEFLLLLPIAALIICIYRNIIGLASFGTFAPALVGLAFRDLGGLPGIGVFIAIVLVGWFLRRVLDRYHLLQVPRMAFLLSLVVIVLIAAIMAANFREIPATKYVSLFPMVILTGMIERFWTLETEDGTSSSFKTLFSTMIIAASISLFLSLHAVVRHMFRFPETLGLIMAVQLLIGRYTGYRLSELFRFRDFLPTQPVTPES
jgi:hypothetical protein